MKTNKTVQIKQFVVNKIDRARNEARAFRQEIASADAPTVVMATALAIGTLISTIPVPLVDMALAAYVMRRFSRMPRAPFFVGMALANNLIMAPLYASTPKVGGAALGWMTTHTPVTAPETFLVKILVGYLLIALGLALGSFALANTGFYGYRVARRAQSA
jgi:hypothetical protein